MATRSFCVHGKALARGVCRAVGELREIVVDHRRHGALAQVVVADVQPARIHRRT